MNAVTLTGIPFTQYHLPNGRQTQELYEGLPDEVNALAAEWIKAGGKFEVEVLSTGDISFTAGKEVDGEYQDLHIELAFQSAPDHKASQDAAVTRLVQSAAESLKPKIPASVNKDFGEMSIEELKENLAYWTERVESASGFASANEADKFRRACESRLRRIGEIK